MKNLRFSVLQLFLAFEEEKMSLYFARISLLIKEDGVGIEGEVMF